MRILGIPLTQDGVTELKTDSNNITNDSNNEKEKTTVKVKHPKVPRAGARGGKYRRPMAQKQMPNTDLRAVQEAIANYEYNMNGPSYNVCKDRPLAEMFETASEILTRPLQPIQCVEAAFVGLRLTQGITDVIRFPISFHSKKWKNGFGPFSDKMKNGTLSGLPSRSLRKDKYGNSLKDEKESDEDASKEDPTVKPEKGYEIINHLVIGLYRRGSFGAVGISRHSGLHSKPVTFCSLADLIWDYSQHYRNDKQQLLSVRLGEAISHGDPSHYTPIWRKIEIRLSRWHIAEQRLYQYQEDLIASTKRQSISNLNSSCGNNSSSPTTTTTATSV